MEQVEEVEEVEEETVLPPFLPSTITSWSQNGTLSSHQLPGKFTALVNDRDFLFHPCSPIGEPDVLDLSDSSESTIFYQKDLFNQGFPMMENIRREGKLCDVNIMVGEHSLQGHRIVLAANIPYFRAMFTHDMAESRQPNITMHSIDPSAAESLINFAYTGRVTISTSNVQNLMMGASFLQLSKVRDACAEFLQVRLSPQNVLGIRTFAERVGSINLVKSSDKFLQKHFKAVSESEEFLGVGLEDVSELVARDELHVITEEVVFLAVLRWIKQDQETRAVHLPVLLKKVRLPLLTPQYLADKVAPEELIRSSHECRDLLDEARDYHLMPERRPQLKSFITRARCCKDLVGVIYAVGGKMEVGDNYLSTVEVYDPIQRQDVVSLPVGLEVRDVFVNNAGIVVPNPVA